MRSATPAAGEAHTAGRPAWRRAPRGLLAGTAAAALVAAMLSMSIGAAHAATMFGDDFQDANATGWSSSGGSWSVVNDGSLVYRQSSTGSDAKAQAGSTWSDQTVQARVKPITWSSGSGRLVGVIGRAQTMTSYYYLALTNGNQVVLGKRTSGGHTTLASAPSVVSTGTWYTLRLEAFGSQLRGYVNGQQVVSASDGTFNSGRIGLATLYASASFDDVLVTDQPGGGQSPSSPPTSSPPTSSPPPSPPDGQADGYAAMNALGQNGTTGGAGGPSVTVDTASEFLEAIARPGPLVIQVSGTIDLPGPMHDVSSDKTIVGLGSTARITGGGLNIGLPIDDSITSPPANAVHNVIIRNLTFSGWDDDAINVQMFSHHVWIDHNAVLNSAGVDGGVDVKRGSDYVTISWNHVTHDKNMLLGHADGNSAQDAGRLHVTYHHNFFDGTQQRNPRTRYGNPVHVYNNYYLANEDYGVRAATASGVLIEGNYFQNVEDTFHRSGGSIAARDNCFDNSAPGQTGGTVLPIPYQYTAQPCADVPAAVRAGAGVGKLGTSPTPPATTPPPTTPAPTTPAPTTPAPTTPPGDGPIGWASMAGGTTGGAGGRTVTVTDGPTLADLLESNERLIIQVQGMITMPDAMNDVHSHKTIIGVGANSGFRGGGLNISSGYSNIIVRNLVFTGWTSDAIEVEGQAHHIWVDHNRFTGAGGGADGSVDIKHGSDYVTVSWNHTTHDKNMLLGHDDDNTADRGRLRVTYHHNWFDGSAERNPRVRYGNPVHVFNNYFDNNEVYGVASTVEAGVLVEGNYFENVPRPIAVGYADSPPGNVVQRHNLFVGSGPVESTGTGVDPIPYGYPLDNANTVPATVMAGAGTGKIG
ncbi:polysaccharide lyase family 1 protein [Micromonospora sp. KC723]|uniref:pectate lyase family protein n=1 Tax=Micromonospora sp. KC723 TaxID=2530381 RepID=UPI0010490E0D|nr:family 16 glycoside hydrolase [Micromonospora sp. KC723]TDB74750.1 DUF1080 domain-containing protein [Micromonospora sp. KC723]